MPSSTNAAKTDCLLTFVSSKEVLPGERLHSNLRMEPTQLEAFHANELPFENSWCELFLVKHTSKAQQ